MAKHGEWRGGGVRQLIFINTSRSLRRYKTTTTLKENDYVRAHVWNTAGAGEDLGQTRRPARQGDQAAVALSHRDGADSRHRLLFRHHPLRLESPRQ